LLYQGLEISTLRDFVQVCERNLLDLIGLHFKESIKDQLFPLLIYQDEVVLGGLRHLHGLDLDCAFSYPRLVCLRLL
jgi:hypothetical protein